MVQERILDMIESNRVEFKRELNDSLEKEVVGFLNYSEVTVPVTNLLTYLETTKSTGL